MPSAMSLVILKYVCLSIVIGGAIILITCALGWAYHFGYRKGYRKRSASQMHIDTNEKPMPVKSVLSSSATDGKDRFTRILLTIRRLHRRNTDEICERLFNSVKHDCDHRRMKRNCIKCCIQTNNSIDTDNCIVDNCPLVNQKN